MNMDISDIITGEHIQQLADVYIGNMDDFYWNPVITVQREKHKYLSDFYSGEPYNNPHLVFCYGHVVPKLADYLQLFQNPFVLISHNSDENIQDTASTQRILACDQVIRWYAQNICLLTSEHPKLTMLPIGIANAQWPHGNLEQLVDVITQNADTPKTKAIYMSFNPSTNLHSRVKCYESLCKRIPFLPLVNFSDNLWRMVEYKYCICPEGNGADTHRMWEALYLGVVPILIENNFSVNLRVAGFPCILVTSWAEWDPHSLDLARDFTGDFARVRPKLLLRNVL